MSVPPNLVPSMELQNLGGPFVTRTFAESLAPLTLQERYSRDLFVARTPATIADRGDVWWVTMNNALPPGTELDSTLLPMRRAARR